MSNLSDSVSKAIVQGIFMIFLMFRFFHNKGQRSGDALNGRLRHKPGSKVR